MRKRAGRCAALLLAWCALAAGGAQGQAEQPAHPPTVKALEKLFKELSELARAGNLQDLEARAEQFILPDHSAWFESAFGTQVGRTFALHYTSARAAIPKRLALSLQDYSRRKLNHVEANRYTSGCRPFPTDEQYRVLALRQNDEPLYDVRFLDAGYRSGQVLWFFAYVDGAFRYIGIPPAQDVSPFPAVEGSAQRIRVGGDVRPGHPVKVVNPQYPPDARSRRIQGTVVLMVLISTEGAVRSLYVTSGNCYLAEAAVKAVRQWRYRPILLNDEPVEVVTRLEVQFGLR